MKKHKNLYHIAIESIDSMGKSTLITELKKEFTARGYKCITASRTGGRELTTGPGVTEAYAEKIETKRFIAKNTRDPEIRQEQFDMITQLVNTEIEKLSQCGGNYIMLWDRHVGSNYAYACADDTLTPQRYAIQVADLAEVDTWIYLTPDLELMRKRQKNDRKKLDSIESKSDAHYNSVISNFNKFFKHAAAKAVVIEIDPQQRTFETVKQIICKTTGGIHAKFI